MSASDDVDGSPPLAQNDLWRAGRRTTMGNVRTIGLHIAKNVFQVHGVDADGTAAVRQRLTRGRLLKFFAKLPPCLVGIEACESSHY